MKACSKSLFHGVAALLAVALSAQAADQPHPCTQLYDDAQRLGCYDGAFGKPRPPEGRPATTTAPAATTVPASAARLPDTFQSPINALSKTADGRFIATLENGQVWLQSERDSRVDVRVGDVVTLRRMLMGNYTMGTRTGHTIRVKRVE